MKNHKRILPLLIIGFSFTSMLSAQVKSPVTSGKEKVDMFNSSVDLTVQSYLVYPDILTELRRIATDWRERVHALRRNAPVQDVLQAACTVNRVVLRRTKNWGCSPEILERCAFDSILICRDQSTHTPQAFAMVKVLTGQESFERFVFLQYLSGNPDNIEGVTNASSPSSIRGAGTKLIEFLVQRCLSEGFSGIYVEALPPAHAFFSKRGFKQLPNKLVFTTRNRCTPFFLYLGKYFNNIC